MRSKRLAALLGLLAVLGHSNAASESLEPFRTQNLSPFSALLGVPRWESAAAVGPGWRLRVDTDLANHLAASTSGNETVILDGETLRTTLALRRRVSARWVVGLDVPYVRHSGGALDRLIDGWHDLFGLPDGGRDLRSRDLLQFEYRRDGTVFEPLTDSATGLGDVSVSAARIFESSGLELHARIKLPTGDARDFTGSGGTDVSLTVLQQRPRASGLRWRGFFWGAGLMATGRGDRLAPVAEDWLLVGLLGSAYQLTSRVDLKAQLELHSAPFDSQVEELGGSSVQLTFGASMQVAGDVMLDLALSEDLVTNSAPDVAFHLGLVWRL